jgi:bacterioferritin-associated ferredoxin
MFPAPPEEPTVHDHTIRKPCPGPCNNAWRRAENVLAETGTEHHLTPAWGQPTQCGSCVERARHQINELPELVTGIQLEALYGTPTKLTGTIGRIHIPAWPGQASRLLLDRILGEMEELATDVLNLRGIQHNDQPDSNGIREGQRINNAGHTLATHLDWMMQQHPAAGEPHEAGNANPGGQIRHWYSAAQRFTKQQPQRDVRKLAPCPRCKGPYLAESRDLRLVDDRPYIECRDPDCRRIMTGAEYDTYVKALAAVVTQAA